MLEARFHPLNQWPKPKTAKHQNCPFVSTHGKTLDDLERELQHLKASDIKIHIDVEPAQIRNDGWPRESASPKFPGVILAYTARGAEYSFACDTYPTWQNNLRAIALTLERLRAIDRYGASAGEQYRGFKALPAASRGSARMNIDEAAAVCSAATRATPNTVINSVEAYRDAYRAAAALTHPDTNGGERTAWDRLQEAKAVLDVHHGLGAN